MCVRARVFVGAPAELLEESKWIFCGFCCARVVVVIFFFMAVTLAMGSK